MCFRVFYVFYEQYLHIVSDAIINLTLGVMAIFLVTFVLLGFDLWSALIVIICVVMIINSMLGMMYLWSIPLNAISLVNLVMVSTDINLGDSVPKAMGTIRESMQCCTLVSFRVQSLMCNVLHNFT